MQAFSSRLSSEVFCLEYEGGFGGGISQKFGDKTKPLRGSGCGMQLGLIKRADLLRERVTVSLAAGQTAQDESGNSLPQLSAVFNVNFAIDWQSQPGPAPNFTRLAAGFSREEGLRW